jgi:hypothetical protein
MSVRSSLCDAMERLLFGIQGESPERAEELFEKLPGRGGFVPRLRRWLEQEPSPFGEPIHAEDLDGIQDHGVDVLLEGVRSRTRIGFQVKSDGDLAKKDFSQRLKAQLLEAQSYGVELMVVIFACRPTDKNLQKIRIVQSFLERLPSPAVRCLLPQRSAALHGLFDQPLPLLDTPERSWSEFFRAVGQPQLVGEYLDSWPGLPPDRRYLPPEEWPEIRHSLETHRLTILIGPPASGKTFTGLQLLWEAFQAGRPVFWITAADVEPTDGPIPAPRTGWREKEDLKRRIDVLLRTLGPEPGRKPVDAHDLISRLLVPGAVVYIEDPFGKTDDEYALSLSSYEYFDVQHLIDVLHDSSARADCRIVLTSREPLFQRWLSETKAKHQKSPDASVITLSRSSYPSEPLFRHLVALAQARELAEPEVVAGLLADEIECPLEGDILLRSLSAGAGVAEAREVLRGWQGDLRSKLEGRLTPDDDGEALVLLLVAAFASAVEGPIYPEEMYAKLHRVLDLPADPQEVFSRSLRKLEPFLAPRTSASATRNSQVLVPHHSVIREALQEQLSAPERRAMLRQVALVLPETSPTEIPPSRVFNLKFPGGPSWYAHGQIAAYLVSLGITFEGDREQAALEKVIFECRGLGRYEHRILMRLWPQLGTPLRERFFTKLRQSHGRNIWFLRESAAYLPWAPLPSADAWQLLEMLFEDPQRGGTKATLGESPWTYLFLHLNSAPVALLTKLDRWARESPAFFVYALEEGLVMFWENLSLRLDRLLLWRSCLLHPLSLGHPQVQERLLWTIAKDWDVVAHPLRELFDFQSRSQDQEIRSEVISSAMFYSEIHPDLERFAEDALHDSDPRIAVHAFRWGRGGEVHRRFAEGLFERATPGLAAEMALELLQDQRDMTEWEREALARCERIGGDAAKAAIVYSLLEGTKRASQLGYELQESPSEEPEVVRAAWVWARLNGLQRKAPLSDNDLMNLLRGLMDAQIRGYCLFYASFRSKFLPEGFRAFLSELSEASEEDAHAIRQGQTEHQPPDGWDRSIRFLIFEMVSNS